MDLSHIKLLALMPVLLTAVSCATVPTQSGPQVVKPATAASLVGDAEQGANVSLPADNALGYKSVVVGRTYYAASGRQCRKLFSNNGTPLPRVSCKATNGVWQLARDLQPVSASTLSVTSSQRMQSRNPVMQQIMVVEPEASTSILSDVSMDSESVDLSGIDNSSDTVATVEDQLRANETLWAFAKRTTGNALNWEAIAKLNGISNANTLAVGASLSIPADLVDQGG